MCPSVSPGITVRPPRSISFALSPASFLIAAVVPDASTWPCPIASACRTEKSLSTVRILPLKRMVSAVWAEAGLAAKVKYSAAKMAIPSQRLNMSSLPYFHLSQSRHCEEQLRRSNPFLFCCGMDCFAEPVNGARIRSTRWLAMTERYSRSVAAVRPLPQHLAQFRLGDLLQRRARHLVDEVDFARHLEVGQRAAAGRHHGAVQIGRDALDAGVRNDEHPRHLI